MKSTTTRREFLAAASAPAILRGAARQVNFLFITADDMNWDAPGVYGCKIPGITPNIDRLASQGLRFERAHVTSAVCQPSRSALMTGRYPHRNGAEGFQPIRNDVPTLQERLHEAGYQLGILSKNSHLAPKAKFCWDYDIPAKELGQGRSPALYFQHTAEFLKQAKGAGKQFFLMANSDDPHRPFAGSGQETANGRPGSAFTRRIEPAEVTVPGFLPDLPDVRREVAEYYTSVHRSDQTVGQILRALAESGLEDSTLVVFIGDNGMAFPFGKTNCYLNSTREPWIVRWPGRTKPGSVDWRHMISGIDFTPTLLDAAGLKPMEGVDGRTFLPLLTGGSQAGRDRVFTVFHETSMRERFEMRAVHTPRYGYIWNPWSDGKRVFKNESQSGLTFAAMKEAAKSDAGIAARVNLFVHRVPEELYDWEADPNALVNLAGDPKHKRELERLRRTLREWMARTGDPLARLSPPPGELKGRGDDL